MPSSIFIINLPQLEQRNCKSTRHTLLNSHSPLEHTYIHSVTSSAGNADARCDLQYTSTRSAQLSNTDRHAHALSL